MYMEGLLCANQWPGFGGPLVHRRSSGNLCKLNKTELAGLENTKTNKHGFKELQILEGEVDPQTHDYNKTDASISSCVILGPDSSSESIK